MNGETAGALEAALEPKKPRVVYESVSSGDNKSELQKDRLSFQPKLPRVLQGHHTVTEGELRQVKDAISSRFPNLCSKPLRMVQFQPASTPAAVQEKPLRVAVVLSGGQAAGKDSWHPLDVSKCYLTTAFHRWRYAAAMGPGPCQEGRGQGGHNVIVGVFDNLQKWRPGSKLFGFLGGPKGVLDNRQKELTKEIIDEYRNQGGFHMIGSGRDKIETPAQLEQAEATCKALELDGLMVIGGDDSNTNAAVLAEYFAARGSATRVIGVPKTIDGDLKNLDVAISFGFDTACKVYSELIGNIMVDAASAGKYFHFVRLMGRSASHITLECALQTHPQMAFVSEEVAANKLCLHDLAVQVADMVVARVEAGRNYGVVLVPEGLIEQVHDVSALISELNDLLAAGVDNRDHGAISAGLTPHSREVFESLPLNFKYELLLERDPHGNVQVARIEIEKLLIRLVARIETEKLLIRLVEHELAKRRASGNFRGKFAAISHYFGYEGRCSLPTNFDSTYCYALGQAAAELIAARQTGLMATVFNLQRPAEDWGIGGTPLVSMMHMEWRKGKEKPVIAKALCEMDGVVMQTFRELRGTWALHDCYRSPGPIQFQGTMAAEMATMTLSLEINKGEPIVV
ncbi:hypothetical protein N2152v2_000093 [Parachlorella kessleri]